MDVIRINHITTDTSITAPIIQAITGPIIRTGTTDIIAIMGIIVIAGTTDIIGTRGNTATAVIRVAITSNIIKSAVSVKLFSL